MSPHTRLCKHVNVNAASAVNCRINGNLGLHNGVGQSGWGRVMVHNGVWRPHRFNDAQDARDPLHHALVPPLTNALSTTTSQSKPEAKSLMGLKSPFLSLKIYPPFSPLRLLNYIKLQDMQTFKNQAKLMFLLLVTLLLIKVCICT